MNSQRVSSHGWSHPTRSPRLVEISEPTCVGHILPGHEVPADPGLGWQAPPRSRPGAWPSSDRLAGHLLVLSSFPDALHLPLSSGSMVIPQPLRPQRGRGEKKAPPPTPK